MIKLAAPPVVPSLAADPTGAQGMGYFNTGYLGPKSHDGTAWSYVDTHTVATLGSDVAASTTLANVTGASLPVAAATYSFVVLLKYVVSAGTTPTIKYAFTGPATSYFFSQCNLVTADTPTIGAQAYTVALATGFTSGTITVSANTKVGYMTGTVVFTASGTLQLQHQLGGTVPTGSSKAGLSLILSKL